MSFIKTKNLLGFGMQVQQINTLSNYVVYKKNKINKEVFGNFTCENSLEPTIPLNVSKAYASSQLYPEYKVLETFKLPNTGVGKVYQLRNGHKVVVLPKKGPTVVNTYVRAGWDNEKADKRECAHLLEHVLGSRILTPQNPNTQEIVQELSLYANAATNNDYTHYYIEAPIADSSDLENIIKLQYETIKQEELDEKIVEKEKNIIHQETYERRLKEPTSGLLYNTSIKNLLNLKDSDTFLQNLNHEAVLSLTKNDVQSFYTQNYSPDKMVTTIVGNVDNNTIKIISKYFNQITPPVLKDSNFELKKQLENTIQKTVRTDLVNPDKNCIPYKVSLNFLNKQSTNPKEQVINEFIVKALEEKLNNIFLNAECFKLGISNLKPDLHMTGLRIMTNSDDIETELKRLYSQIQDFIQKPLSIEEFKQTKASIKSNSADLYEDSLKLSNVLAYELFFSPNINIEKEMQILDTLTPKDVQEYTQKLLDLSKASLTVLHPQRKSEKVSFKGNLNLAKEIDLKEYLLPNNMQVIFDEAQNSIKSSITFRIDAKNKIQVPSETYSFMLEALEKELEKICKQSSIDFGIYGNNQHIKLKLTGMPKQLEAKLPVILKNFLQHDFNNTDDFYKSKAEKLKYSSAYDETISCKFEKELYKGCEEYFEESNISTITPIDVQNLYKNILRNGQAKVVITMPKSNNEQSKSNLIKTLSTLPKFQQFDYSMVFNTSNTQPLEATKVFIKSDDDNQITIEQTYKIIKSGNIKDIAGLKLLNILLGTGENSLMYKKLREEKQLAYSPSSDLRDNFYTQNLNTLTLNTQVSATNKENLKTVIDEYKQFAKYLMTTLIDEKELLTAKKYLKNSIFNSLELTAYRNKTINDGINSFYGTNYFKELDKAIDEITPHDVRELAKYYFSQPSLYLISGNKKAIEENMDYLKNLGEINI